MKIRAVLFGATGMVGEGVLLQALKDEAVESVLVIGRRSCGRKHEKLQELIHQDFFNYSGIEEKLSGYNACFFCLGVSSVGMNEAAYTNVTYDLTLTAARTLARLNPSMTFCYVSGTGTDSTEQGRMMWARVKGKTENDLGELPFKATYAFRPGLMKPVPGQKNVKFFIRAVAYPFPIWKALFPRSVCLLEDLGTAMIRVAESGYSKRVLENADISALGSNH